MDSSIAGKTSDSFISLEYFREYEGTKVTPVLDVEDDITVEKYLKTATTLINSNSFKSVLLPKSVLYSGNISITSNIILFPDETEETFTELFKYNDLIGSVFCVNANGITYITGEIDKIVIETQSIHVIFNENTQDYILTDAIFIVTGLVETSLEVYKQRLKMPRYGLVEGGVSITDLYLPKTFKDAICEVAILLKIRGVSVEIPEVQHGGI